MTTLEDAFVNIGLEEDKYFKHENGTIIRLHYKTV